MGHLYPNGKPPKEMAITVYINEDLYLRIKDWKTDS